MNYEQYAIASNQARATNEYESRAAMKVIWRVLLWCACALLFCGPFPCGLLRTGLPTSGTPRWEREVGPQPPLQIDPTLNVLFTLKVTA